jgi:hypothetical protein
MLQRWVRWLEVLRAEKVCRILAPHVVGKTLDVGCWNGEVASRLDHADIVGIDVTVPPGPLVDVRVFDRTSHSSRNHSTPYCAPRCSITQRSQRHC